jgi:hypothetical protein
MERNLHNRADDHVAGLLNKLIDTQTNSGDYGKAMYELGLEFGRLIIENSSPLEDCISVATTVEDADYLTKGIIDFLENHGKKVALTVFWNKRFIPNKENQIPVAPIFKEFHEEGYQNASTMVIVKSIISSSCVVRTNLTRLIEDWEPERILIVAPVLLDGSKAKLESEFDEKTAKKFRYLYFREDNLKNDDGTVIPGIGGDVYKRLGFESQYKKNSFTPEIVRTRRYK